MSKLKLLDLFSGIGGFSLGLESTGYFETIGFVEKDEFCQKVLRKNFKNKSIEGDIRNVKGEKYKADIITAGFPCQPFSVAGKRRGKDDDRYLWDETIRVIRECKCKWFIGENVEGIINIANGTILQQIQKDLEEEGFEVQCVVIPASGIGAWHQRKRVWIIGHNLSNSNNSGCEDRTQQHRGKQAQSEEGFDSFSRSDIISNTDSYGSYRQKRNETIESSNEQEKRLSIGDDKDVPNTNSFRHRGWSSKRCEDGEWSFLPREQEGREVGSKAQRCDDNTSNSNNKRCKKFNISKKSNKQIINNRKCVEENVWNTESSRRKSSSNRQREGEFWGTSKSRLQCQETWWEIESRICGVPHGVSYELDKDRTNRIKSLGNSIVPLIARELGLAIKYAELEN